MRTGSDEAVLPEAEANSMSGPSLPSVMVQDGRTIPYEEARVHVLTSAVKYATSVFDTCRAYRSDDGDQLYLFRPLDHLSRFVASIRMSRLEHEVAISELLQWVTTSIRANGYREDLNVRLQALAVEENGSIYSSSPVAIFVSALPLQSYFRKSQLEVAVSSWRRIQDSASPPRIKASANYHNSRLALLQAKLDGYDDAILLTTRGTVAEGPGYSIFMVRAGNLVTPCVTDGILEGITRDTVMRIASDQFGLTVDERSIDRTELYVADEIFFCGSSAEVTPIVSVDHHVVGDGVEGHITQDIRIAYQDLVRGRSSDKWSWLHAVY